MFFFKYDIRNFYPSITEKTVNEALKLAKEYTRISEDKMNIIKHCRKSLLYLNEELWIKKGVNGNYDNLMCLYDSAEISNISTTTIAKEVRDVLWF